MDEYEKLMFCDTFDINKVVQAIQLKYENMPEIFYKYRNIDCKTLDAFRNDTLYFSSATILNDPYECALMLSDKKIREIAYKSIFKKLEPFFKPGYVISSEDFYSENILFDKILKGLNYQQEGQDHSDLMDMIKHTNNSISKERLEIEKEIIQIASELYRICSFSEIMDSKLMWTHYANHHQGFCIGYNFKEINDDLRELMLPIIYSDKLLDVTKLFIPITNDSLIMYALSRKSADWAYEKEWRILISTNTEAKVQPQKVPVPKSIYLGNRITQENKIKLVEIASNKNIDVYQMEMRTGEFKLYSEKLIY